MHTHTHTFTSVHGGPWALWWISLLLTTLAITALAVGLYHQAIRRFQEKFVEDYEAAQRQTRRPNPPEGTPALETDPEPLVEPEEIDAGYADVLAQLEQRRKELRRPKPR